jgi:ribosomal protein S18 acetylase RimI-like enzyme
VRPKEDFMSFAVRPLTPQDAELLDGFLRPKTCEAYYLRSNAKAGGLDYEGKFYQAEYIGAFDANKLIGVMAYTWLNSVLVYAENDNCLPALSKALVPYIQKRKGILDAFTGLLHQVDTITGALKIPPSAFRNQDRDGLFRLHRSNMHWPELAQGTSIRRAETKDLEQIITWRIAFDCEALDAKPSAALEKKIRADMARRMSNRELFVLEKENQGIVALSAMGGFVPEAVMVGSVWTPPDWRNRGYGRAVTAKAIEVIASERPELEWAVLFATSPTAIRTYKSIGFERFAEWRLALVNENYRFTNSEDNG